MKTEKIQRGKIAHMLQRADALELSPGARQRLRWFLFAADHRGNASLTCRHFGIARSTFIQWRRRFDPKDARTLEERLRSPRRVRRPATPPVVIARIAELRRLRVTISKEEISEVLMADGHVLSPSTVGRIITRHHLFFGNSLSHRHKRGDVTGCSFAFPAPSYS